MIFIPIIGALLESTGMILEKIILKEKTVNYKNFLVYSFLGVLLVMLPFVYFFWDVSPKAYELKNILIFFGIILVAILANLCLFFALKRENLSAIEPVLLMQPLFTIILAYLVFPEERNSFILILGLIASMALVASHIKKHHISYDKYILAALAGSFLFAVELIASKQILNFYNGFTFYFLRCMIIFIIGFFVFRHKNSLKPKIKFLIVLTSIIWVIYRIILYYGYTIYGVVFTTILFILTPVFLFLLARIFLKEKISIRNIIATIIIVACVALAIIKG
ncbi:MAG: EamA family transporter [Candidatus Nanoarchaeia archaeon]